MRALNTTTAPTSSHFLHCCGLTPLIGPANCSGHKMSRMAGAAGAPPLHLAYPLHYVPAVYIAWPALGKASGRQNEVAGLCELPGASAGPSFCRYGFVTC